MNIVAYLAFFLWQTLVSADFSWQLAFEKLSSERRPLLRRERDISTIRNLHSFPQDRHRLQKSNNWIPRIGSPELESKNEEKKEALFAALQSNRKRETLRPRPIKNDLKILDHLLVVISFSWDIKKLVCLDRPLTEIRSYRTKVDVIIVSDFPTRVQRVLEKWDFGSLNVTVWTEMSPDVSSDDNKYALLWLHRDVFARALETVSHTAYLYLEDDTKFSWRALVSWACDTEALAPLGFQRGIYRTEISPITGDFVLLDPIAPFNLSDPPFPVVRTPRTVSCSPGAGVAAHPAHRRYVQVTNPFQGLWLATRDQLVVFTRSSVWSKQGALKYNTATIAEKDVSELPGIIMPWKDWGYPEKSNGMNLLIDVPRGYMTNNVVPVTRARKTSIKYILSPRARVEHVRNGYSGSEKLHGKILEDDFFTV